MKILINLKSSCPFWEIKNNHLKKLKKEFPKYEFVIAKNPKTVQKEIVNTNIYFGWSLRKEWLMSAQKLEWIISPAAGNDNFPLEEINNKKIFFTNMSGFHGIPMTEQIMGYILGFSRGLFLSKSLQSKKKWWKEEIRKNFFDLDGTTMTIVGCGSVGKKLAKVASAFGINVIGVRRNLNQKENNILWIKTNKLAWALAKSKIVINLLPSSSSTEHFFNKKRFLQFQKNSVFISVGRGLTVDEKALLGAIKSGRISYCAMDVYETKPPKMNNELRRLPNVVMTPKTAVFFNKYMDYAIEYFIEAVKKYEMLNQSLCSSYANRDFVLIALEKYFNKDKMEQILLEKKEQSASVKTSTRDELLNRFIKTKRNHPYLAFTVNSICNRNCVFCEPKNSQEKLLLVEDYEKIAKEAAKWKIKKAHLSGGEPTLRKDIFDIIKVLRKELGNDSQIGLTTHGNISQDCLEKLYESGLTHLNISIHSLNPKNYVEIMRGGNPKNAQDTLEMALKLGLKVKINCVLQRTYTQDAMDVLELAKKFPIAVRLIELQNIGPAKKFFTKEFISEQEFLKKFDNAGIPFKKINRKKFKVRSPGDYFKLKNWAGYMSFISNTSKPVCADGNRIKITPAGIVRPCTFYNKDFKLDTYLENNDLEPAFIKIFESILNRDSNPCHMGFHYIDYNLRWEL